MSSSSRSAALLVLAAACGRHESYRLPWQPGGAAQLTQDCNDSCCNDHVGISTYAYDFAGDFTVVAARSGRITHLKIDSAKGCGDRSCIDDANVLVIDHGDGTAATYLHLAGGSLAPGLACGQTVRRGQPLARTGTTGWSTGVHLHFQVGEARTGTTCECGPDGTACTATPWPAFWTASMPIVFDEWPAAPQCADRRIALPASQNH